jgi:hypothetical protein
MLEILSITSPYFEVIYCLAVIVLAVVGIIGLRQLFLIKYDIKVRYQREANHEAMELIKHYSDTSIPLSNKLYEQRKKGHIPDYKGKVGDFSHFPPESTKAAVARIPKNPERLLDLLNDLEFLAAAVNSGLANEEMVFYAFGQSFCSTVRHNYDIICVLRYTEMVKSYSNIVDLYNRWDKRLKRIWLESKKVDIDEALKKTIDQRIRAIGTDLK